MIIPGIVAAAGGGPAPYHADAVHFDGSAYLETASLTSATSRYVARSFWLKQTQNDIDQGYDFAGGGGAAPRIISYSNGTGGLQVTVSGTDGAVQLVANDGIIVADTWVNIRFNVDLQAQTGAIYAGLIDVTAAVNPSGIPGTFAANGINIGFPDSTGGGYPAAGDFADDWFAVGQNMNMAFAADGQKFIDASGKPVFLGATGLVPTGVAPTSFFTGDASAYPNNQGPGGAFTLNNGPLTNASTSPSD